MPCIFNTPRRGRGDKALAAAQAAARELNAPLLEAAREVAARGALRGKAAKSLTRLVEDFDRWRMWLVSDATPITHVELAERILDESGYTAMCQAD